MIFHLDDKIRYFFNTKTDKFDKAVISLSVLSYFIWVFSFPLFGPVLSHYFSDMRALVIEQGRFMQFYLFSMMASSVAVGYLSDRVPRKTILIWLSAIATSSVSLGCTFLGRTSEMILFSIILGIVSGVNLPLIGSFFSERTLPEDRGRLMGLPLGLSFLFSFLYYIGVPYFGDSSKAECTLVSVLCLSSLATIFFRSSENTEKQKNRKEARFKTRHLVYYSSIVFLLYWVIGVLFSIFIPSILEQLSRTIFYLAWSVPFLLGAFVAGYMFDSMGRSFPALLGLTMTGASLALFGVYGLGSNWLYLVLLSIGLSFSILFSFLVWADLAPAHQRGLFYGYGVGLMCLAMLLGLVSTGTIFGSVSASYIKSYILYSALALFLCIPLLIVVEDLLPKELIEKRKFQEYLEHARKKYINPS